MRRALVFGVTVLLAVQADGESGLRVTAAICGNRECTDRRAIGFAPVRVDVQVVVPVRASNRQLTYGLVCDGGYSAQSRVALDGRTDAPLFVVTHRDVPAGACAAAAVVERADGTQSSGRSMPLIIKSRFGGDQ